MKQFVCRILYERIWWLMITEAYPGILYVKGNVQFFTQIIVTGRLESEQHTWLKVLTKRLDRKDADRFVTLVRELVESIKRSRDR